MKLSMIKSLWGCSEVNDKKQWSSLFTRIKKEGYEGVETIGLTYLLEDFVKILADFNLKLICQIHTTGGYIENNEYVYCTTTSLSAHLESFRSQLVQALTVNPYMINIHSGHDSWSIDMAVQYFEQCFAIEKELLVGAYADIVVVHETHRQRLFYSPYQTRELLLHPALHGKLRINADLSHWCCVCEKVFDSDDPRDGWWQEVLDLVAKHAYYIHCRIGHSEGPQVFDPRDPQWQKERSLHLIWWLTIWINQEKRGFKQTLCAPEHGPHPYQFYGDSMPNSNTSNNIFQAYEVKDADKDLILWDINNFVKDEVKDLFEQQRSI